VNPVLACLNVAHARGGVPELCLDPTAKSLIRMTATTCMPATELMRRCPLLHQACTTRDRVTLTPRRFDVAWRHGLASFVCDYLADVCGDPQTSADPVRAYLLDGRCVADWSQKALQRMRSSVRQVCRQMCTQTT